MIAWLEKWLLWLFWGVLTGDVLLVTALWFYQPGNAKAQRAPGKPKPDNAALALEPKRNRTRFLSYVRHCK